MEEIELRTRLVRVTSLAARYCAAVENARESEREDFIKEMTSLLPRIYIEFNELGPEDVAVVDYGYYQQYMDEDWYETVRRNVGMLMGGDDVFLETFEEDMKYSDTPIAASVSESIADIFQALYNFVSIVRESDGMESAGAYLECHENFTGYWSQTLCNVLRALNKLRNQ